LPIAACWPAFPGGVRAGRPARPRQIRWPRQPTARLAAEAGREIFAVPGSPQDPRARGGNDLIRQGARLTETADDVLSNLPTRRVPPRGFSEPPLLWEGNIPAGTELARARHGIRVLLGTEAVAVDEIARRCQLSITSIRAVILELELAGRAECLAGDKVVLPEDP
jgi:DNA processing protein